MSSKLQFQRTSPVFKIFFFNVVEFHPTFIQVWDFRDYDWESQQQVSKHVSKLKSKSRNFITGKFQVVELFLFGSEKQLSKFKKDQPRCQKTQRRSNTRKKVFLSRRENYSYVFQLNDHEDARSAGHGGATILGQLPTAQRSPSQMPPTVYDRVGNLRPAGQMWLAWTFEMARIRIFVTQVDFRATS